MTRRELRAWAKRLGYGPSKRAKGLGPAEYIAMHRQQKGRCAICDRVLDSRPHLDHDHATGAIRGLLCASCNLGLGFFRDSHALLVGAAYYLALHRTPQPLPELAPEVKPERFPHAGRPPKQAPIPVDETDDMYLEQKAHLEMLQLLEEMHADGV